MKSILEELYYSSEGLMEKINSGRNYKKLHNECGNAFELLQEELKGEQKKRLLKLYELLSDLEAESALAYFKEGFKLCARLILESLGD